MDKKPYPLGRGKLETIREAFMEASSFLREQGVSEASNCAGLLLQHVLGMDRTEYLLRMTEPFPEEKRGTWQDTLDRKAAGEPVQYIIGEQEFYGLPFAVNPAVLIPRPETELLVEAIMAHGRRLWPDEAPLLADVGSGSGAIPVTIAVNCPAWRIFSSDISPAALEVARSNAARNGVADRVGFLEGDLLEPYIELGSRLDILVSNPPYIPAAVVDTLQPEVRDYEPRTALEGGADGLVLYRRMVQQMKRLPGYPRLVGFEVGQGQALEIASLLEELGVWDRIETVMDLAGIERHVIALRERE